MYMYSLNSATTQLPLSYNSATTQLTDPVILSTTQSYGPTDLGQKGISNFFAHHVCGRFCRPKWREPHNPQMHYKPNEGTTFEMSASRPRTAADKQAEINNLQALLHKLKSRSEGLRVV